METLHPHLNEAAASRMRQQHVSSFYPLFEQRFFSALLYEHLARGLLEVAYNLIAMDTGRGRWYKFLLGVMHSDSSSVLPATCTSPRL